MKIIKRIKSWYNASNRAVHAKWGGYEFVGFYLEGQILDVSHWPAAIISYTVVLVTMIAIEAKDKQVGNQPDRLDIRAGMTWPTVGVLVFAIIDLCKLVIS